MFVVHKVQRCPRAWSSIQIGSIQPMWRLSEINFLVDHRIAKVILIPFPHVANACILHECDLSGAWNLKICPSFDPGAHVLFWNTMWHMGSMVFLRKSLFPGIWHPFSDDLEYVPTLVMVAAMFFEAVYHIRHTKCLFCV